MAMGDFVTSPMPISGKLMSASGGLLRRFGFHDETTAEYLLQLAENRALPNFTLAYFPNNDYDSHDSGPQQALSTVERVDEILGTFIEQWGGFERCLEELAIIVTGDHSQSDMADSETERSIRLDEILAGFQIVPAGKDWSDDDDVMACPNLRAAQIYFHHQPTARLREEVATQILNEPRVDQVMWVESERGDQPCRFHVWTSDRGRLTFHAATGSADADCIDDYGNSWKVVGDLAAVDAQIEADGKLVYGNYPNALERLANGFCEDCGDIWMTARPGAEFCVPETSVHPGGSHGTLHLLDSISPLICAGLPETVSVPRNPRSIDIAPLCLSTLGVED